MRLAAPGSSSELREMASGRAACEDVAEARQRLLTPTRSHSGSVLAPELPPPGGLRDFRNLSYPSGLAGVILGVAACGYLSGCAIDGSMHNRRGTCERA